MLSQQPFMRDDTFLGVCEALGEDFGINSNILRIAVAPVLLWNPLMFLGIYSAVGIFIALTRWILPNPAVVMETSRNDSPASEPAPELEPELEAPELAQAA